MNKSTICLILLLIVIIDMALAGRGSRGGSRTSSGSRGGSRAGSGSRSGGSRTGSGYRAGSGSSGSRIGDSSRRQSGSTRRVKECTFNSECETKCLRRGYSAYKCLFNNCRCE